MRHDLPGQLVEQTRVVVVADVVEINEAAHEVVFELLLRHDTGAAHEPVLFAAVQFLDENLVIHRLKADAGEVEIELPVSPRHIADGLDRDAGDINRKLVPQRDGLGHDLGHVHLLGDARQFLLGGGDGLLDLLDNLLLDFRFGQVGGARQTLELPANDLQRGLCRLLFLGVLEEQRSAAATLYSPLPSATA